MRVLAVVPGPDANGVVVHALSVARAVGADVRREIRASDPATIDTGAYDLVHVPFTDALFGSDIDAAAAHFERWAGTLRAPLVVTLHDVPGRDPDPERDRRRSAGYARVAAAADAVVVCSAQEADRLHPRPVVVPLPLEVLAAPGHAPTWAARATLGVLGFVYPGKGHDRALDAAAGTGAAVVAVGGPSPGHERLVDDLHRRAAVAGVELVVTGVLTEADLHAAARAVTVPVCAYATSGASGSLHTWLAAGRRPVTTPGPYVDEVALERPDALLRTTDLAAGVRAALADPATTWAASPPASRSVADAHRAVYEAVLA